MKSLDKLQTYLALKTSCVPHLSQKFSVPSQIHYLFVIQKGSNKISEMKSHEKLSNLRQNAQQRCMEYQRCFPRYL